MPSYSQFLPSLRFRSTLAIAPDGKRVAYVDDAFGQFNLVVQGIYGGGPQRLTSHVDSSVKRVSWHPNGESLLFVADSQGNEDDQIFHLQLDGGHTRVIASAQGVQFNPAIGNPCSPDGEKIAYAGNDRVPGDQDVLVQDMNSGEVQRWYDGGGRVFAGHWSNDGTRLSLAEWREGNSDHIVYLAEADGQLVRRITPNAPIAVYHLGPWLPDDSGFIVLTNAGKDFVGLGVLDLHGQLSFLDTPQWDVEEADLSADGRVLVWTVNVDGASQLRARDLVAGSDLAVPQLPNGTAMELALAPDGRTAVMLLSTPTRPWNIVVVDLAAGELRWVTNAEPEAVQSVTLVEPSLVHMPARGGREIPAYVYRPERAQARAVVMAIHGGPPMQERPMYSNEGFFQYLASCGITVVAPNISGSTGYGMSYQLLSYRDWGGKDLSDLADVTRFLRQQDWVDPDRIGLFGASYGGFAVLSCISRLAEFDWAAAVVWCGPSNLVTFTAANPPTWRSKVAAMVGDPEKDAEFLMSRSPVTYADNIRAPLLVLQGANDPRVPQRESDQIVEQLRARGVDVQYEIYRDEGHGFQKRENQIKARTGAADFLLANLFR